MLHDSRFSLLESVTATNLFYLRIPYGGLYCKIRKDIMYDLGSLGKTMRTKCTSCSRSFRDIIRSLFFVSATTHKNDAAFVGCSTETQIRNMHD